jgi:phosphatidate cytidylyltransferase
MATARRRDRDVAREPRKKGTSDLIPRILVAIPAIAFGALIIWQGEWVFAAGVGALALVCVHELSVMFERARPVRLAAMIGVVGLVVAGTVGDERTVLMVFMATLPLTFFLAVAIPQRERITASISVTVLMIMWIGLGVAHAAMLRGLDHGGALVLMVLLGTFFGDTFAYFGGRLFGRHKMSPVISPNKTWEGLACGIVLGTLVVWYAAQTYSDDGWISGVDGLLLGLAVVIAAPIGDLFESLIKRDMGTKDTGTLFGAHGGALDRVDAALFALVAGYYVWLAVGG